MNMILFGTYFTAAIFAFLFVPLPNREGGGVHPVDTENFKATPTVCLSNAFTQQ